MRNRFFMISGLMITIVCLSSFAAPIDHWFERANGFYETQRYDSTAAYYEKIVGAGVHNSDVYYNLGNTYFRLNKLGLSILYYEKALKLSPHDPDILANIRYAQRNIVDRVPEPERTFISTILWRLHTLFSLNTQLILLFCFLLLLSISFSIGLFASHNVRLWLMYLSSICIILSALFGVSTGIKIYSAEKKKYGIVLEKSVDAKNQPDGNKILFTVHEGVKFQVQKTGEKWSFVKLPNGYAGWVESSALGGI